MKRILFGILVIGVLACSGAVEPTAPFIHVNVLPPAVGITPLASDFDILVEAVVEGNLIQKLIETPTGDRPLPLDFVILFSEEIRGQVIDISVTGFADGVDVFSGRTTGIANADEVDLIVGFCGDEAISDDRNETCDDGANNSDTAPDACRTDCTLPSCGDSVIDSGEDCDDGGLVEDDGCSSLCRQEECGDGIVQASLGESCDDGANNSDIAPDACRTDCQVAFCGDGVVDQGEDCDDANALADDGCDPGCVPTIVQISAGFGHTCILTRSGKVKCWGEGSLGRLGYGNENDLGDDETPDSVGFVNIGGIATQISAGGSHTCALLDTGNAKCWGNNNVGQLGYGNTTNLGDNETPNTVGTINVGGAILQISSGNIHTCALLVTGDVRCWGSSAFGRLGYGTGSSTVNDIGDNEVPALAGSVDLGETSTQISTGGNHTCALLQSGTLVCWGDGAQGLLGYGNTNDIGDNELPSSVGVVNIGNFVEELASGDGHNCALLATGSIRCWGRGISGNLGYGNTNDIGDDEQPVVAGDVNVGGSVIQVVASNDTTCALLENGNVRCWGNGLFGSLGYASQVGIGDNESPASAGDVNIGETVFQLTSGGLHTCALTLSGGVRCWGVAQGDLFGGNGQLGYGNIESIGDDEVPASAGDVPIF